MVEEDLLGLLNVTMVRNLQQIGNELRTSEDIALEERGVDDLRQRLMMKNRR